MTDVTEQPSQEIPPEQPSQEAPPEQSAPGEQPAPPEQHPGPPGAVGIRHHPSDAQYMLIALILAIVTGIEVGVYYIKGLGDAGNPLLLVLAATKFIIVVGFFMHLRFDNKLLRRVFITGIVLAITVYVIVFLSLGVFTPSHGVHG
jgi:cytochrome c oxidase subunit IV